MKRLTLVALLILFPAIVFGSTHYIIVTAHPFDEAVQRLPQQDFAAVAGKRAAVAANPFRVINGFDAELTDDQVTRLIASGEVEDIEPVIERHALDDTIVTGAQTTPWGIGAVKAADVWPVSRGAALNGTGPIHVAVIDTGIDKNAPELEAVFKGGHNFISGTDDPTDDFGHGTHVSGIIAAADNGLGVVGVAPAVDLYGLKVLDSCGSGSNANVMHAIDWIVAKKAAIGGNWVANLSLGSDTPSVTEQNAFAAGIQAGIIFVAAAGNSYDTNPVDGLAYPAGYPGVLSVGAIDQTGQVASFSQRGADLKVVAPGVRVLSTIVAASVNTNEGHSFLGVQPVVADLLGNTLTTYCFAAPNISGSFVSCGFGGSASDFPASVHGKIALIQRGKAKDSDPDITFKQKAQNAATAGAVGVIVYDNRDASAVDALGNILPSLGSYGSASLVPTFLPFLGITQADGIALKATPNATVTMGFGFEGFANESGTSMATPHAVGVVALAWSVAPNAANTDVRDAVINSATDLGAPGVDSVYGHGLVSAIDAAKQLNPAAFGSPATPQPASGRAPGRRNP